jgi:hypothetical protein
VVSKIPPNMAEDSWLVACIRTLNAQSRGAHSCGAVAEFHRFPEHPGDFDYGSCNSIEEPPEQQKAEVDDITFIAGPAAASQKRQRIRLASPAAEKTPRFESARLHRLRKKEEIKKKAS